MKKLGCAILVLVLLLCSCAFAEGEKIHVKLGVEHAIETIEDCFFWSAVYLGFFEEEGLEVELVPKKGNNSAQMCVAGEVDFGMPSPTTILSAVAGGMDLVIVYQDAVNNVFGFVTTEESGIKEWKDFEGKTIAAWSGCEPNSNAILMSAGVDIDTVEYVASYDQRSALLATGTVDAAFTWQGEWQVWEGTLNKPMIYFDGTDPLPNCANAWVCTREYYETHKDIIEKVGRAIAKGTYFCGANPLAAGMITKAIMPTVEMSDESAKKVAEGVYELMMPDDGVFGHSDKDKWQLNVDWVTYFGAIPEGVIDLDDLIRTDEFIEAYNNWDLAEVQEIADNFDVSTIKW